MARSRTRAKRTVGAAITGVLLVNALSTTGVQAQVPSNEVQIAAALLAAPEMDRAAATVLGFRADGSVATIRRGTNSLICLADNPAADGWSVACYHNSLEPFMARGRELRSQGVTDSGELARRRWAEADAGTLAMPETPATLYVMTGEGFDAATGTATKPFLRWVVYTPWATPESTGLPPQPAGPGAPWLMFPGTAGAHIMITPAAPGGAN
jgi:hypothetical protein